MIGIEVLVQEHDNILRMTEVMLKMSLGILKGDEIHPDEIESIIQFVREYADRHHHGKEEEYLFVKMLDELGPLAEKLVRTGMLVEHNQGRYHMQELEKAVFEYRETKSDESKLLILTHLIAYRDLLMRHIQKENDVVFPFAEKNLSTASLDEVNQSTHNFEQAKENIDRVEKHLEFLDRIEQKYNPR